MDKKNLMIGDLIACKTIIERFAKITEIYKQLEPPFKQMVSLRTKGLLYCMSIDEIEPIPLTEEILKVNFKQGAMDDFYYTDGVEIYVTEAGVNIVAKFGIYGSHLDIYCIFVHELQHALRLCGLNELADNFKVV